VVTLDGRDVYTRQDLMTRYGISLSPLEKWYRRRRTTGHPEAVGRVGRELVWDAEEWDRWYSARQDTTALESRSELAARHGLAKGTIDQLWARRGENGHPEPVKTVNQTMYWNPAEWDAWYAEHKRRSQRTQLRVDRSGNPDDLITLSEAARVLGVEPSSITSYPKRPPRGWPIPVEEEQLSSGRMRRRYRRSDIWAYADNRTMAGPYRVKRGAERPEPDPNGTSGARDR
jgi:predicted DNA-binding transcriptional regulator AlpA